MKKNKTLKVACGLLVMVLLTTCVISTTLARYTTSDTASDTARVAKWGVEVSTSGTLFGNRYTNSIVDEGDTSATVQSAHELNDITNVVAPGTKNDVGFQIKIAGKPEVEFRTDAEIVGTIEDIWLAIGTYYIVVEEFGVNLESDFSKLYTFDGTNKYSLADEGAYSESTEYFTLVPVTVDAKYYPLDWKGVLTQTAEGGAETEYPKYYESLEAAVDEMVDLINDDNVYDPNTWVNDSYVLTWDWDYHESDKQDQFDTVLGNLMADQLDSTITVVKASGADYVALVDGTDYNLEIRCEIKVTATQVD